jgi:hypothetical protein
MLSVKCRYLASRNFSAECGSEAARACAAGSFELTPMVFVPPLLNSYRRRTKSARQPDSRRVDYLMNSQQGRALSRIVPQRASRRKPNRQLNRKKLWKTGKQNSPMLVKEK